MPELKAPRITPFHRLYNQSGNSEVWGHLAHPDLQEHNPFLNHPEETKEPWHDGYEWHHPGSLWRHEHGGYADNYEGVDWAPEHGFDRAERHIQRSIHKALPAIAISQHALGQVLNSGRVKSQFETYTSGGAMEPESRAAVEHKFFGYPHDLPNHARPIYGYLTHNPTVAHAGVQAYGEHSLILHKPRIWHRTSAYVGDTLDHQNTGTMAHPVQDFKLSGLPERGNPNHWRLDHPDYDEDIPYTEAHYHGGVGLRDIHYAVLHTPDSWKRSHEDYVDRHERLKQRLNYHKIPWVEVDRGKPVQWEHHLSRLMANAAKGAHMHSNQSQVIGQQGPGRYLIDLGYDDENGNRQAQVADTNTGELHPPMSKDSILARGYWDDPDFDVSVHDVLPHVTPK
jgi:hypothetical protein